MVFRSLRDSSVFPQDLRLDAAHYAYINNLIQTTRDQIRSSRMYRNEVDGHRTVNIEDCFRPEMAQSIRQYKLFTLVSMYSFTRKYVEIDIAHLKSLLVKVKKEVRKTMGLRDEETSARNIPVDQDTEVPELPELPEREDTKHDQATVLLNETFDFCKLKIDLN